MSARASKVLGDVVYRWFSAERVSEQHPSQRDEQSTYGKGVKREMGCWGK
jgi:hypothetical protein